MATQAELLPELEVWLQIKAASSPKTAVVYRQAVTRMLDWLGNEELTYQKASQYAATLTGLASSTVARNVSTCRSFLRHCQTRGLVDRTPIDGLIRPRVVRADPYNRYLSYDEMNRALQAAFELSPQHYALMLALSTTGCRCGEIADARWRDLWFDPSGRLGWRIEGKGGKVRVVLVADQLFEAFQRLYPTGTVPSNDQTPLVNGLHHGRSRRSIWRMVKQVVQRAGIRPDASTHFWRHGYASGYMADANANVLDLQAQLGHSKLETTMVYVSVARSLSASPTPTVMSNLTLPA